MELRTLKEMNLPSGAIVEYDLHPTEDRTREAHVGYFLRIIEDLPEHARSMYSHFPKTPFVEIAEPSLNKNYCPQKITQIPLEEICNLFFIGQSHFTR